MVALDASTVPASVHRQALDRIEELEAKLKRVERESINGSFESVSGVSPELQLTICQSHVAFHLAKSAPVPVSKEELVRRWPTGSMPDDGNLKQHISHLRRRLAGSGIKIITRDGYGYAMTKADAAKVLRS